MVRCCPSMSNNWMSPSVSSPMSTNALSIVCFSLVKEIASFSDFIFIIALNFLHRLFLYSRVSMCHANVVSSIQYCRYPSSYNTNILGQVHLIKHTLSEIFWLGFYYKFSCSHFTMSPLLHQNFQHAQYYMNCQNYFHPVHIFVRNHSIHQLPIHRQHRHQLLYH